MNRSVVLMAAAVTVVLVAFASGYGYHRDELYFRMLPPAWGYLDQPPLTPLAQENVAAFGADDVPAILAALEADRSQFAQAALQTLRSVSPSAVLWTFAIVRAGAGRTLEQCLAAELALTRHTTVQPDFVEGVRAMVVDKDRTPRWSPATIEQVDPAAIAAMFKEG